MNEIKVGMCAVHTLHGNCIILRITNKGAWIEVRGGINLDKFYTFKGIQLSELSAR